MRWIALAIGCMICAGTAWGDGGGVAPEVSPANDAVDIKLDSLLVNTSSHSYNSDVITVITYSPGSQPPASEVLASPGNSTAAPSGSDASDASNFDTTLGLLVPLTDAAWNVSAQHLSALHALIVPRPKLFGGNTLLPMMRFGMLMLLFVLSIKILLILFDSPWEDLVDAYFVAWID